MKKIVSLALSAMLATTAVAGLASCGDDKTYTIGMICLHGSESTYDKNFIDAMKQAAKNKGLADELTIVTGIPESEKCYETAVDLVDKGCKVIFADSFGHEAFMLKAAKENPDVQFCHATGTMAHTENVANFQNAFASIYEGRYLAGITGGLKLAEMYLADELETKNFTESGNIKIGYVGAFPYAEVKSGYTSYFLGVQQGLALANLTPEAYGNMGEAAFNALNEKQQKLMMGQVTVEMDVQFTNSWYDEAAERTAAQNLISRGAALISQHADSMGAPSACEEAGVPNVSYNGSTATACPETYLVSSRINWVPYFEYMIDQTLKGEDIATDWTGTLETESVVLTDFGKNVADNTAAWVNLYKSALVNKALHVFNVYTFGVTVVNTEEVKKNVSATVGEYGVLTSYLADVHNHNFAHDTEALAEIELFDMEVDGTVGTEGYEALVFAESSLRSAPYFDIDINGITLLTNS